jgi:hypothetical protein
MPDINEFRGITGQYPYDIIGITPPTQRFGHTAEEVPSGQIQRQQLRVGGDSEIANRIDDPFAFCED